MNNIMHRSSSTRRRKKPLNDVVSNPSHIVDKTNSSSLNVNEFPKSLAYSGYECENNTMQEYESTDFRKKGGLGMVIDHGDWDENTNVLRPDPYMLVNHNTNTSVQSSQKVRRPLRWRVGILQRKPKPNNNYNKKNRSDMSLADESYTTSKSSRSTRSFHTCHSVMTQKVVNKVATTMQGKENKHPLEKQKSNRSLSSKGSTTSKELGTINHDPSYFENRKISDTLHDVQNTNIKSPMSDGTASTSVSYFEDDDDDDVTVAVMESQEDWEGYRTIGLFLLSSERSKARELTYMKKTSKPSPPSSSQLSPPQASILSKKSITKLKTPPHLPKGKRSPKTPTSSRKTLQYDAPCQIDANVLDNSIESDSSEGVLWQLAKLQAISEGPLTPIPKVESPTISVSSEDDQLQQLQRNRNLKAIHELAERHVSFGEYTEAIDVYREILRSHVEQHGQVHYRVATILYNIATVNMLAGQYEKAITTCKKALSIRIKLFGDIHPDVAVSFAQLGIAYLEMDNHQSALDSFRKALHIRKNTHDPYSPKISKLLNNIGCCLFELGKLKEALSSFTSALIIQRRSLKSASPGDLNFEKGTNNVNDILLTIAATLCNIGSIKLRWKLYDESLIVLEEALIIQESVLGENHAIVIETQESIEFVNASRPIDDYVNQSFFGIKTLFPVMGKEDASYHDIFNNGWSQNPLTDFLDDISTLIKDLQSSNTLEFLSKTLLLNEPCCKVDVDEEMTQEAEEPNAADTDRMAKKDQHSKHDLHWI